MNKASHLWKLEWGGINVRPMRIGRLLTVNFKDRDGNIHSWAPTWDDLFSLFIALCILEKEAPSKKWLEAVADTATILLEICAERLAPLIGTIEGARLLVAGSQELFRKELNAAWEEELSLDEICDKVGRERFLRQFHDILDEVGDELRVKPEGWFTKELLRRLEVPRHD